MNSSTTPEIVKSPSYYSIAIPEEDSNITHDAPIVVTCLKDLQPLLKRNTHARFRSFTSYEEAVNFTKSPGSPDIGTPVKAQTYIKGRSSLPNSPRNIEKRSTGEERPNNFPTPKPQDLALINTYITRNIGSKFMEACKLNPRLLCTDCDLAPAVHEGTRLNALHAAAKNNNLEAAKMILDTISDISFFESLYPKDDVITRSERCRHLNVSYLNTPDKMLLETPLHFAAKFNSVDVLRLLVLHPLCNLYPKNDQGLTPLQIVGSRYSGENSTKKGKEVASLLENEYIVPIWRDALSGSTRVGMYGKWKSFGSKIPKHLLGLFHKFPTDLLPPLDESLLPQSKSAESYEICSYAGPTTKEKAKEFHGWLKESSGRKVAENATSPSGSPSPRTPTSRGFTTPVIGSPNGSPVNSLSVSPIYSPRDLVLPFTPTRNISKQSRADMTLRMEDGVKGLERLCRNYANALSIPWNEFWKFLNTFCNLESRQGLELFENFLLGKENSVWEEQNESSDVDPLLGSVRFSLGKISPEELEYRNDGETSSCETMNLLIESIRSMRIASASPSSSQKVNYSEPERRAVPKSLYNSASTILIYNNEPKDTSDNLAKGDSREIPKCPALNIEKLCWEYRDNFGSTSADTTVSDIDASELDLSTVDSHLDGDDDDDRWSFTTAASQSDEDDDEVFVDCADYSVFIDGRKPKENDKQAFNAIKNAIDDEILLAYPALSRWYNTIKAGGYITWEKGGFRWMSTVRRASPPAPSKKFERQKPNVITSVARKLTF